MSDSGSEADQEPLTRDEMLRWFETAERKTGQLIGTEQEKFGVFVDPTNGRIRTATYAEDIGPLLHAMIERFGWQPAAETGINGAIVGLLRDGASITLEPGGQLELSGAPLPDLHATCAEFTDHYTELDEVARGRNLGFMTCGFHPYATREEIAWVPKGRYKVMREYLPTRGNQALDMMVRTCTVQANFDYADEGECGQRLRLALATSSLFTAIFANSPYREGEQTGQASNRSAVWSHVDPDRCGLLEFALDPRGFSYERYVDWALDVPMFFVKRDGTYHANHVPFRTFLEHGFSDQQGKRHRALRADWELHLSTLFPEVRLKPYIEIRGADSVGSRHLCAVPALGKGVLCDPDAAAGAWELVGDLDFAERLELWEEARTHALASSRVQSLCRRLVTLARESLERLDVRDSSGRTEARFLESIEEVVDSGRTPADLALSALGPRPGVGMEARRAFLRQFRFAGVEI